MQNIQTWPDETIFFLEKSNGLTTHILDACGLKTVKKIDPYFASSLS